MAWWGGGGAPAAEGAAQSRCCCRHNEAPGPALHYQPRSKVPQPPQGGCSCGVVGRTGSGKSSLMLALFRLIDVTAGRVLIDGVETTAMGLDALRSQMAIIPQVRVPTITGYEHAGIPREVFYGFW